MIHYGAFLHGADEKQELLSEREGSGLSAREFVKREDVRNTARSLPQLPRMQSVIGEYESLTAAVSAVRGLESQGLSIQNVVIADQRRRMWRKLHPSSGQRRRQGPGDATFLVFVIDELASIERTRAVLHPARNAAVTRTT